MYYLICNKNSCFFLLATFLFIPLFSFKLGIENVSPLLLKQIVPQKTPCTIGLITNQTGVDQYNNRTIDILLSKGFTINYIFAPEHGITGTKIAGKNVIDSRDKKTNIPIMSLYGNGSGKMITAEQIAPLDALFFDIQDSGMRHYTYISTLFNTMKLAAEYNKPFVVLDRPNPLGSSIHGSLVEPELISFISIAPIPLRHGLTIGELAHYFNHYLLNKKVLLQVVAMSNYDKNKGFNGPFLHQLSPNLPSLQSCYGYSFLGLLGEITPFNVGIGTPMAFRCILLPKRIKTSSQLWSGLQKILQSFGVRSFTYNKPRSTGLRLEFDHINDLQSFDLLIAIIHYFKNEGIPLSFSATFNQAVGTKDFQEMIAGTLSKEKFRERVSHDLQKFYQQIKDLLLYCPVRSPEIYKQNNR